MVTNASTIQRIKYLFYIRWISFVQISYQYQLTYNVFYKLRLLFNPRRIIPETFGKLDHNEITPVPPSKQLAKQSYHLQK
jgi:hypothetical protein